MAKATEFREMSDEQIRLTWRDAAEHLFRLRIQSLTERLDAPSELRRQRRTIARCQTILNERRIVAAKTAAPKAAEKPVTKQATPEKTATTKSAPGKSTPAKAAAAKMATAKK